MKKQVSPLKGKTIVLGVTGSIAAYKAAELLRLLKDEGAQTKVVLTANGQKFITALTLSALSGSRVYTSLFHDENDWEIKHVSLAENCDLLLVAPATAGIISKFACGLADDLLSTLFLAVRSPVLIAPAMNDAMYRNPATVKNIETLTGRGVVFAGPEEGKLASGRMGTGRLAGCGRIIEEAKRLLAAKNDFKGIKVLVSAGPTREPMDAVRFLSNPSSGKMGYETAKAACRRGAEVTLISGPVNQAPVENARTFHVSTALDMREKIMEHFDSSDVVIMTAAVSDYRFRTVHDEKLHRGKGGLVAELEENPDILKEMGMKKGNKVLAGFSMDVGEHSEKAKKKMADKNLDLIAVNDISQPGAGFGADTNIVRFIDSNGNAQDVPMAPKSEIADKLLDRIIEIMGRKRSEET